MTARTPPAVEKPEHKIAELTTYELRDYRRALEEAIAFVGEQETDGTMQAGLQARLTEVIEEQDERARIARG